MKDNGKKILFYKNYNARIGYSEEDGFLVGHIMGVRDIVGFHGATEREITAAFHQAVDDYLDACRRIGKKPQKPRHRVSVSPKAFAAAQAAAVYRPAWLFGCAHDTIGHHACYEEAQ